MPPHLGLLPHQLDPACALNQHVRTTLQLLGLVVLAFGLVKSRSYSLKYKLVGLCSDLLCDYLLAIACARPVSAEQTFNRLPADRKYAGSDVLLSFNLIS